MFGFIGISKVEVNDRFLDQVVASRREGQNLGTRAAGPVGGAAASEEVSSADREQALAFIKSYFSPGGGDD